MARYSQLGDFVFSSVSPTHLTAMEKGHISFSGDVFLKYLSGGKRKHFFPQVLPSGRKGKSHQRAESFSPVQVPPCARAGCGGWKTVPTLSLTVACQVVPMPPVIWAQTSVSYQCFTNATGLCLKGRKASCSGHFLGSSLNCVGGQVHVKGYLRFSCECVLC